MMTRLYSRERFSSQPGLRSAAYLVLVLSLDLAMPTHSEASRLSTILTPSDQARPELLDQNGLQLQLPSPNHPHPTQPNGSTPTYVAFPLHGGEHLPGGTVTLTAGSQGGQTAVGPLSLDTTLESKLNSALAASASGMAVVDTPNQNYLVEYLPRHTRSHSGSTSSEPTTGGTNGVASTYNAVRTWLATDAAGAVQTTATAQSTKTKSSSASELASLLNSGSSLLNGWSTKSVAELEKLLKINSSQPTATKPSLNLEAQELGTPAPAPIPEPSAWLVFGLILGAAGIRQRLSRG